MANKTLTNERLWLNDKIAVVGLSNINPLTQKKAKVKSMKLLKAKLGVARATPFKPTQPAMLKPKSIVVRPN
ncbi:MAG TPA: hypothetical protein DDY91_07500 [Planctomycetaceae bacterium]|jgi:hypothetical protein|nr:hypothetical protein [Planctomycetaceae bacterium]